MLYVVLMTVSQNPKWVTVLRVFEPAEADLFRSRLEAARIPVQVKNIGPALAIAGYGLAVGGILVQVPAEYEEEALAILKNKEDHGERDAGGERIE